MDVVLRPELERFVAEKVRAGEFADVNGVMNAALEALKEQDEFSPAYLDYLRREVKVGVDELNAGEFADFDAESVIREQRAKLKRG